MSFADRLAVVRAGRLEQVGPPEAAYLRPRTAFVASFLGTTNLLRGEAHGRAADTPLGTVALSDAAEGRVLLSLRPEALRFDPHRGVAVTVVSRAFKGHDLTFRCALLRDPEDPGGRPGDTLIVQTGPECGLQVGDVTRLRPVADAVPLEISPR